VGSFAMLALLVVVDGLASSGILRCDDRHRGAVVRTSASSTALKAHLATLPGALALDPKAQQPATSSAVPPRGCRSTMCAADRPAPLLWLRSKLAFDREKLAGLGVDAFLTYGVVSNLNAALLVAFSVGMYAKASGLSPLAPGAWKGFLATYAGIYAVLGTVLRPFRLALAVSLTPVYGAAVRFVQARLPTFRSRPKLNRTLAIVLISLLGNTVGTCSLMIGGCWLAGIFTGVPLFPPGWTLPGQ